MGLYLLHLNINANNITQGKKELMEQKQDKVLLELWPEFHFWTTG